ncbi:MAG: hypothetical protein QME51_10645 [Planctomycetota bacterium]|nr:hypothetical protein [Planctomycetota bacterium]
MITYTLKYIVFNDCLPLVFPAIYSHDKMVLVDLGKPTSAGFVDITENGIKIYGKSESLKLESREADKDIIEAFLTLK